MLPEKILPSEILEVLAAVSGATLLVVADDGSVLSFDERFARAWSIPAELLSGGTIDAVIERLRANGDQALAELLAKRNAAAAGEIVSRDGRTFTWRAVTLSGTHARVWAFDDVTTSRQLATALQDANRWLRMLEAHTTDGVVLELDTEAKLVGVWASCSAVFEKPGAQLRGKGLAFVLGEPHGSDLDARVRRVLSKGQPESFEYVVEVRGRRRVLAGDAVLHPGGLTEPPRVTIMIRDVTERARMQSQVFESERLASVGLLAAGVAHEINNPLAYILLNLERLHTSLRDLATDVRGEELEPMLDAVEMSLEGSRRVQAIVRDLQSFSRSDFEVDGMVPLDVHQVLDLAIDMTMAEASRRACLVRSFGELPFVSASERRLSQVFLNLLVNAVQAIPEGAPDDHEIRIVTFTDERGRAVVEVRDTGEGMSPSVMQRIFEPFFSTKAPGVGAGLGLAICYGIATSLGGEISVESAEGRGSTFRLYLPAAAPAGCTTASGSPPAAAALESCISIGGEPETGIRARDLEALEFRQTALTR